MKLLFRASKLSVVCRERRHSVSHEEPAAALVGSSSRHALKDATLPPLTVLQCEEGEDRRPSLAELQAEDQVTIILRPVPKLSLIAKKGSAQR